MAYHSSPLKKTCFSLEDYAADLRRQRFDRRILFAMFSRNPITCFMMRFVAAITR